MTIGLLKRISTLSFIPIVFTFRKFLEFIR